MALSGFPIADGKNQKGILPRHQIVAHHFYVFTQRAWTRPGFCFAKASLVLSPACGGGNTRNLSTIYLRNNIRGKMKKIIVCILVLILAALTACTAATEYDDDPGYETDLNDQEVPIQFQTNLEVREALLIGHSEEREEEITHIVLHFISNVIANPGDPYVMEEVYDILYRYGLSAHYIIDREGNIYLSVPEDRVAWHAGRGTLAHFPHLENRLNHHSIGIEIMGIGTLEEMSIFLTPDQYAALHPDHIGFTDAQYESLNGLINDILSRHAAIQPNRLHIIGHDEYDPGKPDPGRLFEWDRLDFMMELP